VQRKGEYILNTVFSFSFWIIPIKIRHTPISNAEQIAKKEGRRHVVGGI
jgi:hypothetical protein